MSTIPDISQDKLLGTLDNLEVALQAKDERKIILSILEIKDVLRNHRLSNNHINHELRKIIHQIEQSILKTIRNRVINKSDIYLLPKDMALIDGIIELKYEIKAQKLQAQIPNKNRMSTFSTIMILSSIFVGAFALYKCGNYIFIDKTYSETFIIKFDDTELIKFGMLYSNSTKDEGVFVIWPISISPDVIEDSDIMVRTKDHTAYYFEIDEKLSKIKFNTPFEKIKIPFRIYIQSNTPQKIICQLIWVYNKHQYTKDLDVDIHFINTPFVYFILASASLLNLFYSIFSNSKAKFNKTV